MEENINLRGCMIHNSPSFMDYIPSNKFADGYWWIRCEKCVEDEWVEAKSKKEAIKLWEDKNGLRS